MDEMQIPQRMQQGSNIQNIYSRILTRVMPYIERTVDNLAPSQMLTDDVLDNLTDNIISESNILTMIPNSISPEEIFGIVRMLLVMDIMDLMDSMDSMDEMDGYAAPAMASYNSDPDPRFGFFPPFFFYPFFFPRPIGRRILPPQRRRRR